MEQIEKTTKERLFVSFMWVSIVLVLLLTFYQYGTNTAAKKGNIVEQGGYAQQGGQPVDTGEQIAELSKYVQANPTDVNALIKLGDLHFDARQTTEALKVFEEAEKLVPNNVHVLSDIGALYRLAGNFDVALSKYQAAYDANPDHLESLFYIGQIYLENMDESDKADQIFRKILAGNPNENLKHLAEDALKRESH
jgi:tetratricopeptide (TPR) repeat protein